MAKTDEPKPTETVVYQETGIVITSLAGNAAAEPVVGQLNQDDNLDAIWSDWGIDNLLPMQIREKLEKSTTALPLMYKAVQTIFGNGVEYFTKEKKEGKIIFNFEDNDEIDEFFIDNRIDYFMLEQLMDYKFFGNLFQEYIMEKKSNNKKICNIFHKEAEFSRVSLQDEKTGKFEKLGYSGQWSEQPSEDDIDVIPLLDPFKITKDEIDKISKGKKFAYHSHFPSPGRQVYAYPPHGGLYRKDGWLDYSNSVPEIMNSMINCQSIIKYHIKIPYQYWMSLYPKWDDFDAKKQKEIRQKTYDDMNEFLSGKKNAYKSFISHYAVDPITKKELPGWEIISLDDKTKKDDWIPSNQEANSEIARAIGIDPSAAGIQQGTGKMGAGSGSDKRVAMINSQSLSKAEQVIVFQSLHIIKKYNDWPKNICFGFSHSAATTIDKNPTGNQNTL